MDKVYIGKVVKPHGIKGEIRILSNFPFKDKVFVVGNEIIIKDKSYKIMSYRVHKGFDMITLNGFSNINDILFLLKQDVYFDKSHLSLTDNDVLDEELITFDVYDQAGNIGKIVDIFMASSNNKIIRVMFDREVLIPLSSPVIKKIDKKNKKVDVELIEGM